MRMIIDSRLPSMTRSRLIPTLCLLAGCLVASPLLQAQNTDWTPLNLAMTDAVVIPAYERFAAATAPLARNAAGFCAAIDADSLAALQQDFSAAYDGWQGVQHIQFGPITWFNWNFRLQFWPDDKGTGARQLDALLATADPAVLVPEAFAQQSVGVQGFPALERLLFSDDSLVALQNEPYRCQTVQAISRNLDDIASGVAQRWRDEFRTTVANADERGFFESAEDATIDYMKAVVESVRRIQQQKVQPVLGDNQAAARERRAEAWRMDRSVQHMRTNVAALAALFNDSAPALSSVLQPADLPNIQQAFATLQQHLADAPDSMNTAITTAEGYAAFKQVDADLDALFELLEAGVKGTDLYLGFNSLDGD